MKTKTAVRRGLLHRQTVLSQCIGLLLENLTIESGIELERNAIISWYKSPQINKKVYLGVPSKTNKHDVFI